MCAAHAMPEWRGKDSFAAEAASFGEIDLRARAENMPVALSMRVVAAPASFALPMVQRKVFKPPFTVRVRAPGARASSTISMTVLNTLRNEEIRFMHEITHLLSTAVACSQGSCVLPLLL